ncbi:MAG: hypothetical protein OXH85_14190 [Truepera sp.]|nr:hypothetical protein [Truepera sp.]
MPRGGPFAEGKPDLVVSDRRAALDRAARVVTLRGGWVEAEGTPLEGLLLRSAEMWHLWRGGDRGGSGVSGSE